ncbi:MAG: DUF58 domain-containing protein [Candidatus Marinimicrobia bacterium]|nr:DUF58 domain-containing protein [Candidatus Neomarinimicrobiota bacterium]
MQLIAKFAVEGFIVGLHKSPYHGFSVEFAEHRPYNQGDEVKNIDWKLFGKTDRFYVKEYEEETNLKSYILLDKSGSMNYTSQTVTKFDYAAYLSAALSYLMLRQQDAISLTLMDDNINTYIPPAAKRSHLDLILKTIQRAKCSGDTVLAPLLHQIAEKINKIGLIILISDLFDDPDAILSALKHFRYQGHEVIVFHVMDKNEIEFNFTHQIKFIDMENRNQLLTESQHIRENYKKSVDHFIESIRNQCLNNYIDYKLLTTDRSLDVALMEYLNKRKKLH